MEAAHAWAAGRYRSVYLYAHVSAISFYERLGYVAEGEIFEESGAPHIFMRFVAPTDVA
jgi:predicted GNAT family N-acyltransferase